MRASIKISTIAALVVISAFVVQRATAVPPPLR
jgi:hypothetical protein